MFSRSLPHWLAPTMLVGSFLAGVGLAVGHHLYYQSLDGVSPEGRQYNPVTIGTAIVFLVRTTLIITVTTAYWQVFWRVLRRKLPIATIDSLAGALSAVYEVLSFKTLRASPLLVGLVLLGWCIRVAIIFPAGTIAPGGNYTIQHHEQVLQYPNFTKWDAYAMSAGGFAVPTPLGQRQASGGDVIVYVEEMEVTDIIPDWVGPTTLLRRNVAPVLYRGIPSLQAPYTNSSYNLTFTGPAVRCENMEVAPILGELDRAMADCFPPDARLCKSNWMDSYQYLSWTPWNGTVPFKNQSISNGSLPEFANLGSLWPQPNDNPASLMLAFRNVAGSNNREEWTVLNCGLHNATYEAAFDFQSGDERVNIIRYEVSEIIGPKWSAKVDLDRSALWMFALEGPKRRAYYAIMEMFGEMLTGTIFESLSENLEPFNRVEHTRILESNLAFTQEMYPIYMKHVTGSPAEDLSLPTLASAIEQLMQNMTISFFSEPALLTNASEIKTDVVVSTYNIVYFYNWQRLALSYSAVLLLALVAMIIGLYTIFSTGQSYSNNFSTILRVAQNENLAALIEERDRKGQDPLPKHIAKARFGIETVGDGVQLRRRVGRGVGPEHETLKTQYVSASEVS